jgi:hypothetical protein
MAKREALFTKRDITIEVNDAVMEYLEDLAKSGLYGNTHAHVAEIVLSLGLKQLIDSGALTLKAHPFLKDGD